MVGPKFEPGRDVWLQGTRYTVYEVHHGCAGGWIYDLVRDGNYNQRHVQEYQLSATPPDPYQGWTLEQCRQEVRRRGRSLTIGELCDTAVAWPRGAYEEMRGSGDSYEAAARALLRKMDKEGAK